MKLIIILVSIVFGFGLGYFCGFKQQQSNPDIASISATIFNNFKSTHSEKQFEKDLTDMGYKSRIYQYPNGKILKEWTK